MTPLGSLTLACWLGGVELAAGVDPAAPVAVAVAVAHPSVGDEHRGVEG